MDSDESHFNVSVGSEGQSDKTVSTNHNLSEEKGEPKRYWTEVLPLTSLTALPLGQTGSLLHAGALKRLIDQLLWTLQRCDVQNRCLREICRKNQCRRVTECAVCSHARARAPACVCWWKTCFYWWYHYIAISVFLLLLLFLLLLDNV